MLLMFFTFVNTALLGRCSCALTCSAQRCCGPGALPSPLSQGLPEAAEAASHSGWSCWSATTAQEGTWLHLRVTTPKSPLPLGAAVRCAPSRSPPFPARRKEGSFGWCACNRNTALPSWKGAVP